MNETVSHIISKFNWDTTFNKKGKAPELQQRLSNWSRISMPGEIAGIFDRVCPPGQTWKIHSMELDLGDIDFDNLEFELAENLRIKLKERLVHLILYANAGGNDIEIVNEGSSHIYMLSSFLLNGLMPWNHKPVDGSYNAMLAYQLQNNRQKMVVRLKEVGVTHENVRKRMAWQTNEQNMLKMIEGLEPNNHEQIIIFSEEFIKIQVKETIVQTSAADFKKNLWLWVLNYLFTERGSIFNRLAYMKSTIRQMAAHYNITYGELLKLIERAVSEVHKSYDIKAGFMLTLEMLLKEDVFKVDRSIINTKQPDTDHWAILKRHFENYAAQNPAIRQNEFNELVVSLYREDAVRFSALMRSFNAGTNLWLNAIADLNDASLEYVFTALSIAKTAVLLQSIYFIDGLSKQLNLNIERKKVWEAGLKFLLRNKNTTINNQAFISYCIATLSKQAGPTKAQMLNQFTSVKIPSSLKTISGLAIYADVKNVFIAEVTKKDMAFLPGHFTQLITALSEQIIVDTTDKALFVSLQKLLMKNIQFNPVAALKALIQYPDKNKLHQLMPYVLNNHTARLLVTHAANEKSAILLTVERVLLKFNTDKNNNHIAFLTADELMMMGLTIMIGHPEISLSKFMGYLLEHIAGQLTPAQEKSFALFLNTLRSDKKLNSWQVSAGALEQAVQMMNIASKLSVMEKVKWLMASPGQNKQQLGSLLTANITKHEFVTIRSQPNEEGKLILDYLLPQGSRLMDALLKEYINLLTAGRQHAPDSKIIFKLNELYWQCVLNYNSHSGNVQAFKKIFGAAVLFHFPVKNKTDIAKPLVTYAASVKMHQIKNGQLTQQQVFLLIELCFESCTATIAHAGVTYYLNNLLETGLELSPSEFRKIIAATPVSEKRIDLMMAAISFSKFSQLIMNDGNRLLGKAMEVMLSLYELVEQMAARSVADESLRFYWQQAWLLIKNNTWSAQSLNLVVQKSLGYITSDAEINTGLMISLLKENNIKVHPMLGRALARQLSSFSVLVLSDLNNLPDKQLQRLDRAGLLTDVIEQFIQNKQAPPWFGAISTQQTNDLLNAMITYYPVKFLSVLKARVITVPQMLWLGHSLSFKELTRAAGVLNRGRQSLLNILFEFYVSLSNIPFKGVAAHDVQQALFSKVLKAWIADSWRNIAIENIWNELIWELCGKRGLSQKTFILDLTNGRSSLPPALQVSLGYLSGEFKDNETEIATSPKPKVLNQVLLKKEPEKLQKHSIFVRNAGLVMLSSYIPELFKRLDLLINAKEFHSKNHQAGAVHYLQYAVTGLTLTEEGLLPLNKILCGLLLSHPVKEGIDISEKEKKIINGLISAVISHWPRIGKCSVDGFRGNWLVRNGLLTEQDDRWELTVEKRPYDMLISKSPFSFSIIRYPWMPKPLYVTWPY